MALQVSGSKVTTKLSTRLTEVYWEVQPAADSEYWPFADVKGTEYILFASRDGSIGYYKEEEGANTYSKHLLGLRGKITSMASVPLAKNGYYDGRAFVCVKAGDGCSRFYRINIVGGTLKYSRVNGPAGYKPIRVAGGVCIPAGQALAWFLYDVEEQGERLIGMQQWVYQMGEEKEFWYKVDREHFDFNSIGPAAIPDNYMDAFLFHPNTDYIHNRKGFRAEVLRTGKLASAYWCIPDEMYPAKLIQIEQVNLTALESYSLMMIEKNGRRSLWFSRLEQYNPVQFRPLAVPDDMELEAFSVRGIRRNNRDILSITGTAHNYPGKLYHSFCDPRSPKELNMIPIADDVLSYRDCINAQYEHLLYYVSKNKERKALELRRLCYDIVDDEWEEELVAGDDKGAYRAVPVYEHRLCVTDVYNMPVSGAEVKISTDTHMILESGGQFIPVDKESPKMLQTDVTGCLAVYHETHSLSDGDIHMELSACPSNGALIFSPAEMQRKYFEKVERASLQNAKDSEGNYILTPERRRDTRTLDNICQSVRDIAGRKSTDQCFASGCKAFCLEKKENGAVERTELTGMQFDAIRREMLRDNSFWTDLADFFRSIARGIAKVVKTIVQVVEKAIQTVVEFVIDGVKRVVDFVVDTVHHIVDTVESVLGMVLEAFEPLFSWIGELIGVNSIIRTQNAVKFLFGEAFALTKNHAEQGVRFLRDNLTKVSREFDQSLDAVCRSLGPATFASYRARAEDKAGPYSNITDNYVTDLLKSPVTAECTLPKDFYAPLQSVAEELLAYLQTIADRVQNEPDFREAEQYLMNITKNQGTFLNNMIAAFLKGMAGVFKLALSMLADFCESVVRLGLKCLEAFQSIVEQKIWIPVLGSLFKMVFRQDLTLLNLASLLIAMPANSAMKVLNDRVSFENDRELALFEEECRRALNPRGNEVIAVSEGTKKMLTLLCCGAQIEVYACVALSDATFKMTGDIPDCGWSFNWDALAIIGNLCWVVCACPHFSGEEPSVGAYGAWFICMFNLIIDFGVMEVSSEKDRVGVDSVAAVVGCIMGLAYTIFDICNWIQKGIQDVMLFIDEIFICLQSIGRICMLPVLIKASKEISRIVEVILDGAASLLGVVALIVKSASIEEIELQG